MLLSLSKYIYILYGRTLGWVFNCHIAELSLAELCYPSTEIKLFIVFIAVDNISPDFHLLPNFKMDKKWEYKSK